MITLEKIKKYHYFKNNQKLYIYIYKIKVYSFIVNKVINHTFINII